MTTPLRRFGPTLLLLAAFAPPPGRAGEPKPAVKTEHFDADPGWEGFNNRVELKRVPTVTQDFGYSPTKFAAKEKGELGGKVTRAARPASYAAKVGPKTLDDKLTASGTFALTGTTPGCGIFFGFFHADQPGGSGRPVGSLGIDLDGEREGGRLAVRMINQANKSCGTFATPFIPGKFRPTPIRNDGTRYAWTLTYDPAGAGGRGRFEFTLRSDAHQPGELEKADLPESYRAEARKRFPSTTAFAVDLPNGFKKEGATFDRFGLMNLMKAGGTATIYFGDLALDGKPIDLTKDPGWEGSGNRVTYEDRERPGAHDFGFSPKTSFAGGSPGEVGGSLWRSGKYAYYADRVGPLSLDDRLEASGKVVLQVGAPDSDMYIGWFNGANKEKPPAAAGHFVGVHVGGPTRVGHYFHPVYTTGKGTHGKTEQGPVLTPGKAFDWSLVYDPAANGGLGEIKVTLGKESVALPLKRGQKAEGATLDRFGLCTSDIGGQQVKIYLDDLKYTGGK
jgi:hypothetical protein